MALDPRVALIAVLKIPAGQTTTLAHTPAGGVSQEAKYVESAQLAGFKSVMIATPEDALTGVVTVRALYDHRADETNAANYVTVQSPPGTDVAIAATKAIVLTEVPFPAFILVSTLAEADEVVFYVYGKRF